MCWPARRSRGRAPGHGPHSAARCSAAGLGKQGRQQAFALAERNVGSGRSRRDTAGRSHTMYRPVGPPNARPDPGPSRPVDDGLAGGQHPHDAATAERVRAIAAVDTQQLDASSIDAATTRSPTISISCSQPSPRARCAHRLACAGRIRSGIGAARAPGSALSVHASTIRMPDAIRGRGDRVQIAPRGHALGTGKGDAPFGSRAARAHRDP
jgi:hypothetical protein